MTHDDRALRTGARAVPRLPALVVAGGVHALAVLWAFLAVGMPVTALSGEVIGHGA